MNTVLPPARDLPPRAHLRIRAELERAVTGSKRRDRRRLLPVLAAGAAMLGVAAVVAVLVPGRSGQVGAAGRPTPGRPPAPPSMSSARLPDPVMPGMPAEQRKAIERGCGTSALGEPGRNPPTPGVTDTRDTVRLYNLLQDQAGRFALLYGEHAVLDCTLDRPGMPYNSGLYNASTFAAPNPVKVDFAGASSGGDVPGNKATDHGTRGSEVAGGRISAQVAKVTLTHGTETVTATLANGTFLARIVYSSTWSVPVNYPPGVIRAYDANGTLLATLPSRPS